MDSTKQARFTIRRRLRAYWHSMLVEPVPKDILSTRSLKACTQRRRVQTYARASRAAITIALLPQSQ
jgi:hypothetical protein